MVIGISEIKSWNPYQLVVYDFNGNLIFKKRITNSESKLEKVFIWFFEATKYGWLYLIVSK